MASKDFSRTCLFLLVAIVLKVSAQSDGDVRLVGGSTPLQGRLEVFYQSEWGTVCNLGWDTVDSAVVCQQLGYLVSQSVPASPDFGSAANPQRIWLSNVQCEQTDARLLDCEPRWGMDTTQCSHMSDVNVICSGLNVGVSPNYEGCYLFTADLFTSGGTFQLDTNTVEDCIESCASAYSYAGMYGTHCTCGVAMDADAVMVDACTTTCPGNPDQICGTHDPSSSSTHVSVFSVAVDDGYLASPWFPGSYVTSNTDTSQEETFVSTATGIETDSSNLLLRFLALDLADGDTLMVEVDGATALQYTSSDDPMDVTLTRLATTVTVTATLTQAAGSVGSAGYLIMPIAPPRTTTTQATTQPPTTTLSTTTLPTTTLSTTTRLTTTTRPTTTAATIKATTAVPTPPLATSCMRPVVDNGTIVSDLVGRDYRIDETVILKCDTGLNPSENTLLFCQADGTWNPPPVCRANPTGITLEVWVIIVIVIACFIVLMCLICIFMCCVVALGRDKKRRDERILPTITHMRPGDNNYTGRPPLIPITEAAASGDLHGIRRPQALDDPPPTLSNDAVQQTEPIMDQSPQIDPPTPTETYPPRDYPGASGRDSMLVNGLAGNHMNGNVNNLGKEERQAVDELFNAVRDYDDSPTPPKVLYGSVPPRHLRTGSAVSSSVISVISNPGRVTDAAANPRYSAGYRARPSYRM